MYTFRRLNTISGQVVCSADSSSSMRWKTHPCFSIRDPTAAAENREWISDAGAKLAKT